MAWKLNWGNARAKRVAARLAGEVNLFTHIAPDGNVYADQGGGDSVHIGKIVKKQGAVTLETPGGGKLHWTEDGEFLGREAGRFVETNPRWKRR